MRERHEPSKDPSGNLGDGMSRRELLAALGAGTLAAASTGATLLDSSTKKSSLLRETVSSFGWIPAGAMVVRHISRLSK